MIFCVDAFNVVPVHGMVRLAEEAFGTGMVADRHIPPPRPVRGWLPTDQRCNQFTPATLFMGVIGEVAGEVWGRTQDLSGEISWQGLPQALKSMQSENFFDGISDGISAFQKPQTLHPYGFSQTVQVHLSKKTAISRKKMAVFILYDRNKIGQKPV